MEIDNRYKRIARIIRLYYEREDGLGSSLSTKEKFYEWLLDERDSDIKNQVLEELWSVERGGELDESRVEKIVESIRVANSPHVELAKQHEVKVSPLNRVLRYVAVLAPIALMLVASVVIYSNYNNGKKMLAQWEVPYGTMESYVMNDNSEVDINAGSRLTISQNRKERLAELSGESYFKVAKESKRPFVVRTKQLEIAVTGTEFNVEAYPNDEQSVISLIEGSLVVDDGSHSWSLVAGEQLIYDNIAREALFKEIEDVDIAIGWLTDNVVCNLSTLSKIFNTVERRYNIDIVLEEGLTLSDTKYTIRLDASDSPKSVMDALRIVTNGGFDYVIEGDKIVVMKPHSY